MAEMSLAVADVKLWAATIISALERSGIATVPLIQPYYHTAIGNIFDLTKDAEWGVGDVVDDIADLRSEIASYTANEGMVLWHALEHLQGVLGLLVHAAEATGTVAFLDNGGEA
ncbi:hypothetical protein [Ancylobacter sp.]|uniref:hypothetical protein n=1 Tax=Ancylobacter sp. TaxID=1872567 RepID=UPI003D101119